MTLDRGESTDEQRLLSELTACLIPYPGGDRARSCEVVQVRSKLRKVIVELEVASPEGANGQHYICKVYKGDRGSDAFNALSTLYQAGFRPPRSFTVVRPIAYIAEAGLLLQEKAPGQSLKTILESGREGAADALSRSAKWLAALHASGVEAPLRHDRVTSALARFGRELAEFLPRQADRLDRLTCLALHGLEGDQLTSLVPSHGDWHSNNVFLAPDGRVTAIDFDTFGLQERAADVAYFMAQLAIRSYLSTGCSFAASAGARDCFLHAYEEAAIPLPRQRMALYLGMAFLQSLHYELCVLHTKNLAIVEPWLSNSERCLSGSDVTLLNYPPCFKNI